jgi:nucleoid DNA-binding protein
MKESIKFTKENLIKDIAKQTNKNISDVRDIYNALEKDIFDILSSVSEDQNVCIKLFEGISLDGIYIPEKTKKNNLTGKTSFVESKIKPKFNVTRSYYEKLNNQ